METKMAIIITTNDSSGEQTFATKSEVKFDAVQEPKHKAEVIEENPEDSATEDNKDNEDKSFDYLNPEDEDDDSDNDLDEDDDDSEDEDGQVEKPKKNGFKKRIDKLTKRNSDYESRIAQLEAELQGKSKATPEDSKPIEDLKEPDINDFEHIGDYTKALTKYQYNEELKATKVKNEQDFVMQEAEKITAKFKEKVSEARERYGKEKWDNLQKIDLPMSIQMRAEIMQSDIGPDILYFLFHNGAEAKRINSLTPAQQIKELTKLEIKVESKLASTKTAKKPDSKTSKAPEPVKPLNSKTSGTTVKDPSKMSYKEYKTWRAAQK